MSQGGRRREKLKVVWVCTFSNPEKRSHLSLWQQSRGEYGQWIPNLVAGFRASSAQIDLHVISVEPWLRSAYQTWTRDGVTYHCVSESFPILGRAWPSFIPVDVLTHYASNSRRIQQIVESLQPDVVHLFGAENPHYAASILGLQAKYPVLICIQGFGFREPYHPSTLRKHLRLVVENRILQSFHYFMGEYETGDVLKVFNRSHTFFPLYFPVNEALAKQIRTDLPLKHDLLFVGRLVPQKGILDFVNAVAKVRDKQGKVSAAIVGSINEYPPLRELVSRLRLTESITFLPRFPSQEGLFALYRQSRLFVVPTYNDCFPSTIRECAFLGTPVLAYKTGGIPYANRNGLENVALVAVGDVEALAERASAILEKDEYRDTLSANLRALAAEEFALERNVSRIVQAYNVILDNPESGICT